MTTSQLCFMVGAGRSGTTWLWRSVGCHPDVLGVPESHLFGPSCVDESSVARMRQKALWKTVHDAATDGVVPDVRRGGGADRPYERIGRGRRQGFIDALSPELLGQLESLYASFESHTSWDDVARELFSALDGVRPWIVEKTPRHALQLDRIRELYPDAKIIGIVRDGRDVLTSLRARGMPWTERISEVHKAAAYWVRCNRAILTAATEAQGSVMVARYEDFLADFEGSLRQLLQFLGLDDDPEIVTEIHAANTFEAYTGRRPGEEARGEFNRKGVAGSYLDELPMEDIAEYEERTGAMLEAFGYALTASGAEPETAA